MRLTRRGAMATALAPLAACDADIVPVVSHSQTVATPPVSSPASSFRMPDEAERHVRTWMAFGPATPIWDADVVGPVQENLALIANTIAEFEPVSMLTRPSEFSRAKALVSSKVTLVAAELDDLWIRDTGPTFATDATGARVAISFNFNGWGNKQAHATDAHVAALVAREAGVPLITAPLTLEGGCLEVDGRGSGVFTRSCILNDNRNPGLSQAACEAELTKLLGVRKFLWLPGIAGKDITDGHVDFYARFAGSTVMVGIETDPQSWDHDVTARHLEILSASTAADGTALHVRQLAAPTRIRPTFESKEFAAGYVGYYVCNGAVIAQEFGDADADAAAQQALAAAYPGRTVIALNVDALASGGGSIHCAAQQEITAAK